MDYFYPIIYLAQGNLYLELIYYQGVLFFFQCFELNFFLLQKEDILEKRSF